MKGGPFRRLTRRAISQIGARVVGTRVFGALVFGALVIGPVIVAGAAPPEQANRDPDRKPSRDSARDSARQAAASPVTPNAPQAALDEEFRLLKLLVDTLDQVERNYAGRVSRRELLEAAIDGMMKKLDPHSRYIPRRELAGFRRDVDSQYGGLGVRLSLEEGYPLITSPIVGGPAHRAGVQAGDRIVAIDGKPAGGLRSIDAALSRLKGKVGSRVVLRIQSAAKDRATRDVTISREVVRVPTVLGDRRKADDRWDYLFDAEQKIGYIRIESFGRHTAAEMRAALEDLRARGMAALVLDLRNNAGGLLSAAIEVADLFLPEGVIVSTRGRNQRERTWRAHKTGTHSGFPLAVLVNGFSASASEIVAACLQDHRRAVIVGVRTWGKGSVQSIIELDGGKSAVKLTTGGYHRPSGKNIHRHVGAGPEAVWGVKPDPGFRVPLKSSELRRAQRLRFQNDLLRKDPQGRVLHTPHIDPQLARALDYVRKQVAAPAPEKSPAKQPAK